MGTKIDTSWLSLVGILFGKFISATGEEIGWRGFFQPSLDKKYSKIISSVIVGIIWGLWHTNNYNFGLLFMCLFILNTISISIIIECLLKNTQYNIIISSIFHTAINIFAGVFYLGIMENYLIVICLIMSIIWAIPAIIVVLCEKKYFFIKTKITVLNENL
jgi:membrane protease YdiL (CAAX protease family)